VGGFAKNGLLGRSKHVIPAKSRKLGPSDGSKKTSKCFRGREGTIRSKNNHGGGEERGRGGGRGLTFIYGRRSGGSPREGMIFSGHSTPPAG